MIVIDKEVIGDKVDYHGTELPVRWRQSRSFGNNRATLILLDWSRLGNACQGQSPYSGALAAFTSSVPVSKKSTTSQEFEQKMQ